MSIYSRHYEPYRGELEPPRSRVAVIAVAELRRLYAQKWVRRLVIMSWTPALMMLVFLYGKLVLKKALGDGPEPSAEYVWFYKSATIFAAIMMAGFGASMIARDVRHNALSLYFTRPLRVSHYLLGKLLAVMAPVLLITLVPGLVMALAELFMGDRLALMGFALGLGRVVAVSLVIAFVNGTVILLLSSLGRVPRNVGLAWIALFVFLEIVRGMLAEDIPGIGLVSLKHMLWQTIELVFEGRTDRLPGLVAALAVAGFSLTALHVRLQSLERRSG